MSLCWNSIAKYLFYCLLNNKKKNFICWLILEVLNTILSRFIFLQRVKFLDHIYIYVDSNYSNIPDKLKILDHKYCKKRIIDHFVIILHSYLALNIVHVCFVDRCLSICTFSFWPLCCLFFFDIRILITSLCYLQSFHAGVLITFNWSSKFDISIKICQSLHM